MNVNRISLRGKKVTLASEDNFELDGDSENKKETPQSSKAVSEVGKVFKSTLSKKQTKPVLVENKEKTDDEELSSEEEKSAPKKSSRKKPKQIDEEDEDDPKESKKVKAAAKKALENEEIDAIAIIYDIPNEKHPFHHLDKVPDSIETEKLVKFSKENVINY